MDEVQQTQTTAFKQRTIAPQGNDTSHLVVMLRAACTGTV